MRFVVGICHLVVEGSNSTDKKIEKVELSNVRIGLSFGSTLYIGVEDVSIIWEKPPNHKENVHLPNNVTDMPRYNSLPKFGTTMEMLNFNLQISCTPKLGGKPREKDVILQTFKLIEMKNQKIAKSTNGQTLTLINPWVNNSAPRSHLCLPDAIMFKLFLERKQSHQKEETFLSQNISQHNEHDGMSRNEKLRSLKDFLRIKFRFNYLVK